jgi:hypothetical protein
MRLATRTQRGYVLGARRSRTGWAEAARAMAAAGHAGLLDAGSATRFDQDEWEWR